MLNISFAEANNMRVEERSTTANADIFAVLLNGADIGKIAENEVASPYNTNCKGLAVASLLRASSVS